MEEYGIGVEVGRKPLMNHVRPFSCVPVTRLGVDLDVRILINDAVKPCATTFGPGGRLDNVRTWQPEP